MPDSTDLGDPTEHVEAIKVSPEQAHLELQIIHKGLMEFRCPFLEEEFPLCSAAPGALPSDTPWTARLNNDAAELFHEFTGECKPLVVGECLVLGEARIWLLDTRWPVLGSIECVDAPYTHQVWKLKHQETWLGRKGKRLNHIDLGDSSISRTQATFRPKSGGLGLLCEAANSTINGESLTVGEVTPLRNGDLLGFGRLFFRYTCDQAVTPRVNSTINESTSSSVNLAGVELTLPNRFQLKKRLGQGGMAAVYHAFDGNSEREVALKLLPPSDDETLKKRFHREAADLANVYHPNVVEFYSFGEHGDLEFIEMEYVNGGTLSRFLRRCDSLKSILEVFAQIFEGLAHIHEVGLVHRDMKPANVLINEEGVPKISDLGLARREARQSDLTEKGTIIGTASYLAPEQMTSPKIGPSVDIYATGICLFEAVTGEKPFRATSKVGMLRAHLEEPPPRPSDFVVGLPQPLDDLVLKMLEKKPENRPSDPRVVAQELREIASSLTPAQDALVAHNPEGLLHKARLHVEEGRSEEALRILDQLEEDAEPSMIPTLVCERARALIRGRSKSPQVLKAAELAVEECRKDAVSKKLGYALLLYGQAATQAREWEAALVALKEARELIPSTRQNQQIELLEALADLHIKGTRARIPGFSEEEALRYREIAIGLTKRRDSLSHSHTRDTADDSSQGRKSWLRWPW